MKKYNLSAIMKRAWEVKKENSNNIFSACLKMAWTEAKKVSEKKEFTGYAEIESDANFGTLYTFKLWEKYGKRRIYASYRGNRSAGYIDLSSNECVADCKAYRDAMEEFLGIYNVA